METQGQDFSRKRFLSGAFKEPDAFWGLIVPSARLQKRRLDTPTGAYPAHPQTDHAEELESTQPMVCKEKGTPHLHPNVGVTSKDTRPVERGAKGKPEASTRKRLVDFYTSIADSSRRTQAQPTIRGEKGSPKPIARVQPAYPYIGPANQLKRTPLVDSDEYIDDGGLSETKGFAPIPAFHKRDKNEEDDEEDDEDEASFEGHHDTRESDGDDEYIENDEDNSETTSGASSHATKRSRSLYGTSPRARARVRGSPEKRLKNSKATTPKRKTGPCKPAGAKGRRPIKKLRVMAKGSDQEDEEETTDKSLPQDVTRPAKTRAPPKRSSIQQAKPPLLRKHLPWSMEEDDTFVRLYGQGKSWEYIGGELGRTAKGAQCHLDSMRKASQKSIDASRVSERARIPRKWEPWTKKETETLISLRAQGMSWGYISRRIRGRGYHACKSQWPRVKDKDPQAATAKDLESDKKGASSDRQIAQGASASQLDQETRTAESTPHSAIVECENPESSTNGGSPIDPDDDVSAAKPTYEEAVAVRLVLPSSTAGKSPESKATSAIHCNGQASQHLTVGEDPTPSTDGLSHQDQPSLQPAIARKDPEIKKEWSCCEDLTAGISAQGKQKLGIHRRSYSWS